MTRAKRGHGVNTASRDSRNMRHTAYRGSLRARNGKPRPTLTKHQAPLNHGVRGERGGDSSLLNCTLSFHFLFSSFFNLASRSFDSIAFNLISMLLRLCSRRFVFEGSSAIAFGRASISMSFGDFVSFL